MALYTYITNEERFSWKNPKDDEIRALLKKALKHDKTLMVSEAEIIHSSFFGKSKKESVFYVYHEIILNGKPTFQAKQQLSASGKKDVAMAYLYGIINSQNQ